MIQFIDALPENVIGIRLVGEITKEQYDTVYAKVEGQATKNDEINYLVVVDTTVGNIKAGVWWDDFKLAIKHFGQWHKLAIVSDDSTISKITETWGGIYPGESKAFSTVNIDEAVHWVSN